jgi:hypothetical protein
MMTAKNWLVETPFSLPINNSKKRREEIRLPGIVLYQYIITGMV